MHFELRKNQDYYNSREVQILELTHTLDSVRTLAERYHKKELNLRSTGDDTEAKIADMMELLLLLSDYKTFDIPTLVLVNVSETVKKSADVLDSVFSLAHENRFDEMPYPPDPPLSLHVPPLIDEAHSLCRTHVCNALAYLSSRLVSTEAISGQVTEFTRNIGKRTQEVDDIALNISDRNQEIELEIHKTKQSLAKLYEDSRNDLAEVAVSKNAVVFKAAEFHYRKTSTYWIIAASLSGGLTLATALFFLSFSININNLTISQSIQLSVNKALILAGLAYSTIWCGRNYQASVHNAIVNRHRHDALRTFKIFTKAACDQDTRMAILLHASQTAFSGRTTGFDKHEESPQVQPVADFLAKAMLASSKAST